MAATYFEQMLAETPTRVWVNNPTLDEIDLALGQGALGCTTNPAYGGGLLKRAPELIRPIIAEVAAETSDERVALWRIQERLVQRVVDRFRPLFESSGGSAGYVSIQGSPDQDGDADTILEEAHAGHSLGPNAAPKIPATEAGLRAFQEVVAADYPVIVTEVFSVAQLIETCERYRAVASGVARSAPFILSPITGILGDYLKVIAARDALAVRKEEMEVAGVALARECYRVVRERGYPVTLLCGGARTPFDLTGFVGADVQCTINWSTFADVIADPAPMTRRYDEPIDAAVLERLTAVFPDVARALAPDGLAVDEFEAFGPVQHFRDSFLSGWHAVRDAFVALRRP